MKVHTLLSRLEVQVVIALIVAVFTGIYTPDLTQHISWI